jgi:hypothetical protein
VPPGEFVDGHHLDRRDADVFQEWQVLRRRVPRALGRERADVHLVEDLRFGLRDALPVNVRPRGVARVDHLRGAERSVGLRA